MDGTEQRTGGGNVLWNFLMSLDGFDGFDSAIGDSRPWGGRWQGPIFVLTHHPEDAPPTPDITFLSCSVDEAARIALEAAGGKDLMVFSPTIGAQFLERELIDEIDIHVAPVLLGQGIRLYSTPAASRSAATDSTTLNQRRRFDCGTALRRRRAQQRWDRKVEPSKPLVHQECSALDGIRAWAQVRPRNLGPRRRAVCRARHSPARIAGDRRRPPLRTHG